MEKEKKKEVEEGGRRSGEGGKRKIDKNEEVDKNSRSIKNWKSERRDTQEWK